MALTARLLLVLTFVGVAALPASSQDAAGPLASLLARGSNLEGPFATHGLSLHGLSLHGLSLHGLSLHGLSLHGLATRRLAMADSVVQHARNQLGRRYRFASASPDRGFDCSGLVKYVLKSVGVELPHSSARIAQEGVHVEVDSAAMRPGDLLLFGRERSSRISHVGIYVGEGRMIHASTSQRRVVETWVPFKGSSLRLHTVRRVLRDSTTANNGSE